MILRNSFNDCKKVCFQEENINSIQALDVKDIIRNLVQDYSLSCVNNDNPYFLGDKVYSEIEMFAGEVDYSLVEELCDKLELDSDFLNKEIDTLSYTEKIYLNIMRNLCKSSKVIIFEDIFKFLDYNNQKIVKNLLEYLKNDLYTIIVTSSDVNVLYKLADYSILWYNQLFEVGTCDEIYTNVSLLIDNMVPVPILPYITYKAMAEKNIKLFYSKDVRDIIKDIYKHV